MRIHNVELKNPVSGKTLEGACNMAAINMRVMVRTQDEYLPGYSLSPVHTKRSYAGTNLAINQPLHEFVDIPVPLFKIKGINRESKEQSSFKICSGLPYGIASEEVIEEYLSNVSGILDQLEDHKSEQ
ncbi:hypothetical protein GOV04_04555 [Candidatus Woesearchaeota archaeon]|nr:hypothetical protein [Candidatus Woesearchaeota archaeon]